MKSEKIELVVVGAGGFGREVIWQIERNKELMETYSILGFVDDSLCGGEVNGYPVVGNLAWLAAQTKKMAVVVAIGNAAVRKRIASELMKNASLMFPTLVADNVIGSKLLTIGKGSIICLGTIATVNISIGEFCIINLASTIGHDVVIEDFVTVYPGANISGNVTIHETTEIGTGAKIIQGKEIGANTVIGAGTVVIRDIPEGVTAVGNPARIVKSNSL